MTRPSDTFWQPELAGGTPLIPNLQDRENLVKTYAEDLAAAEATARAAADTTLQANIDANTTAIGTKVNTSTYTAGIAGKMGALAPTAVKTSAYTAVAGDLVPVDTTTGAVAIALPAAPADKTVIAVKHVIQGATNAVTVNRGGTTDVFNKAGGSTFQTLALLNQGMVFVYNAAGGIWYVFAADLALSQLDARYPVLVSGRVPMGQLATGTPDGTKFIRDDGALAGLDGTLVYGPGAPSNSTGKDGDSYVDTTNARLYGPKAASVWPGSFTVLGPGAGASPQVLFAAAQPTGLTTPAIWVPTNSDGTPKAPGLWQIFTPDPTPGIPLSQLHAWYSSRLESGSDGDALSTIKDRTPNGRDLSQATPSKWPILKTAILNGKPVYRFTEANLTSVSRSGLSIAQPFEIYMVFLLRTETASKANFIAWAGSASAGWDVGTIGTSKAVLLTSTSFVISSNVRDPVTWNAWRFSVNGASSRIGKTTADTQIASGNAGATGISNLQLGTLSGAATDIDIAEVVITNGVLNSTDKTSVLTYFNSTYGVT